MASLKRVVALISGRGSNLQALIKGVSSLSTEADQHYRIVSVISDKEAPGFAHASAAGISTQSFTRDHFESRNAQRQQIFTAVRSLEPDFVVLAGFMMIVPTEVTEEFFGKLVNIHPSLLPEFPGLDTHERAIAAGRPLHGCTTHFVDSGVDTGPLIAQASCTVTPEDSPESLAARVLPIEHKLFPWTLNRIASGDIQLNGRAVRYSSDALKAAQYHGFKTF